MDSLFCLTLYHLRPSKDSLYYYPLPSQTLQGLHILCYLFTLSDLSRNLYLLSVTISHPPRTPYFVLPITLSNPPKTPYFVLPITQLNLLKTPYFVLPTTLSNPPRTPVLPTTLSDPPETPYFVLYITLSDLPRTPYFVLPITMSDPCVTCYPLRLSTYSQCYLLLSQTFQ